MLQRFRTFLAFLLAVSLALPASAQTTRILDGNYVTKYGRFRNFVINPDGQLNNNNTTRTNTTLTVSTTTPISENGTSEFNLTVNSSNGTVDFLTSGATQAMLGGQMCEVGFRGRGFQSTSTLQAFDGTNVLATYVFGLLSNTTDVSLPFPCPTDPSNIRVRITDTATLAGTNEIAGVYFGRVRTMADAANITTWQSYTPTISAGFGTPTNVQFYWRRVGDTLEVYGRFNTGTVAASEAQVTFPSGLTADTAKLNTNERIRGRWTRNGSSANESKSGPLIVDTVNLDRFKFSRDEYALTNNPFVTLNGNSISNNGDVFVISGSVPIANWPTASSALTPSASGRECVYNSNTTDADTTASGFAVGQEGTTFGSFSALRTKRVRFSSPILDVRSVNVSVTNGTSNGWMELDASPFMSLSGTTGIGIANVSGSTTDFDVRFGASGFPANVASGGAGAWSGISGNTNFRWRVCNFPAGTQAVYVRSPVISAGTGTAPLSNEVGYTVVVQNTAGTALTTGGVQVVSTPALDPGCYNLDAVLVVTGGGGNQAISGYWQGIASNQVDISRSMLDPSLGRGHLALRPRTVCHTVATSYTANAENNAANSGTVYGTIRYTRIGDR